MTQPFYFNLEDFNSETMNDDINSCLDEINVWLNKLTVNVSKTIFMVFHKRRDVPKLNLSLNNINIESVSHFTFLGIILDTALSWKYHINMIAIKISKVIGILHKLKYIFPKNIVLTIYKSLILPHLNYGLLLWGVHLQDISVLQKKAIRVVTNNTYKSHTEPIFKEYGLLNVNDMFLLNKLKFLHKLFHNNLPVFFEGYWEHFTKPKQESGASPGFGRGGGPRIFFFRFGNLHVAKRHAAHGEATCCAWQSDMLRMAKPCALLGGFGGMLPLENFLKRCNFVRLRVYFD